MSVGVFSDWLAAAQDAGNGAPPCARGPLLAFRSREDGGPRRDLCGLPARAEDSL